MQITKAGKQLVEDQTFASTVKYLVDEFQARGMSDEESIARVATMIAWAAVGGDVTETPTNAELIDLQNFCDDHAEEINALTRTCFSKAFRETVN
jgi:hypothetical protein